MSKMTILENITRILDLYTKCGSSDYIGESITQIEHALQCARLASQDIRLDCYDNFIRNCVIVAALLHDIGHLIGLEDGEMQMRLGVGEDCGSNLGIVGHEGVGSAFLQGLGMPKMVYELVAGHVPAKRYLCTTRSGYYDSLSDASKLTMQLQGGMMNNEELHAFCKGVIPELKVYLREYDDASKKKDMNLSSTTRMQDYKIHLEMALMHNRIFI
jgi:predicted HD phosphohydrolase